MNGHLVPYGPDFTPVALSKAGIDREDVLSWLLASIESLDTKKQLQDRIAAQGFGHINKAANRRDMASHVVQALGNYGLMNVDAGGGISLTDPGRRIAEAALEEQHALFARHVLIRCNGQRFVDSVREFQLRGVRPTMELLAARHDRHSTSKSISSLRM